MGFGTGYDSNVGNAAGPQHIPPAALKELDGPRSGIQISTGRVHRAPTVSAGTPYTSIPKLRRKCGRLYTWRDTFKRFLEKTSLRSNAFRTDCIIDSRGTTTTAMNLTGGLDAAINVES